MEWYWIIAIVAGVLLALFLYFKYATATAKATLDRIVSLEYEDESFTGEFSKAWISVNVLMPGIVGGRIVWGAAQQIKQGWNNAGKKAR